MRTAVMYNFLLEANLMASIAIVLMVLVRRFARGAISNRALLLAWLLVAVRLLCPLALPNPAIHEIRPTFSQDAAIRPIAGQLQVRFSDASQGVSRAVSNLRGGSWGGDPLVQELDAFVDSTFDGSLSRRLMIGYLIGLAAVLAFFGWRNLRFRHQLRAGRIEPISGRLLSQYEAVCRERGVRPIPVYFTDPLPSACLVGVFRPYIALPLTAAPQEAITVLTHEVCHYRGRDHLWGVLRLACCALHWFNPLVWLAAQMSRTDAELACDDRVVQPLDAQARLGYTQVLVLAAARRNAPGLAVLATGMTMTGRRLKTRVNAILSSHPARRGLSIAFVATACVLLVLAFATAELREHPTMPTQAVGVFGENVARPIDTEERAIAYARAFWASPALGLDGSAVSFTVEPTADGYTVQGILPGTQAPSSITFAQDGTVFAFYHNAGWSDAQAALDLYTGDSALQQEAADYVRRFMASMLPHASALLQTLTYQAEATAEDQRYVAFVGKSEASATAFQFALQVLPTVRMVSFSSDAFAREQLRATVPGAAPATRVNGFLVEDYALSNSLFTTPPADALPLADALNLAVQTLIARYGETAESVQRFAVRYGYRATDDAAFAAPYWQFDFMGSDPLDMVEIILHSPDGEVLYTSGNGEGNG